MCAVNLDHNRLQTVVLLNHHGAVLQYPTAYGARLVEAPYGTPHTPIDEKPGEPEMKHRAKRKKRSKRKLNAGEAMQMAYHSKIEAHLMERYTGLLAAAKQNGYVPVQHPVCSKTKDSDVDTASLCQLDMLVPIQHTEPLLLERELSGETDVFGRMVCNSNDTDTTISVWGRKFLIPSGSSFLLSDISKIDILQHASAVAGKKYDLIVIDPPWENRSTIRAKKYDWLPMQRLLELPIDKLAAVGALVAVWVTNKRKYANFVRDVLFPAWGLTKVGEWHWIKTTTTGELVADMDSIHKKPYEIVVIGESVSTVSTDSRSSPEYTLLPDGKHPTVNCTVNSKDELCIPCAKRLKKDGSPLQDCQCFRMDGDHVELQCTPIERVQSLHDIPYHNAIFCVPSTVHSQKPYLGDLLSQYHPSIGFCLELFARNLIPDWTSWGNEILKCQEI